MGSQGQVDCVHTGAGLTILIFQNWSYMVGVTGVGEVHSMYLFSDPKGFKL